MKTCSMFPSALFAVLFAVANYYTADVAIASTPEYRSTPCDAEDRITDADRHELYQRALANIKRLGIVNNDDKTRITLNEPIDADRDYDDPGFYIITNYYDHAPNQGEYDDWNCGNRSYDQHYGTDFATWPFPFYHMDHDHVWAVAAAGGTLVDRNDGEYDRNCDFNSGGYGNYVMLQHSNDTFTIYAHLKNGTVIEDPIGNWISVDEPLGTVASSGNSTCPHLHFEFLNPYGEPIDPFFGPCSYDHGWGGFGEPGWTQYYVTEVNQLYTHGGEPELPDCPSTESPRFKSVFEGGDQILFSGWFRDIPDAANALCIVKDADGAVVWTWTWHWNQYYAGSYFISGAFDLPLDAATGKWTFSVDEVNGDFAADYRFDVLGRPVASFTADPASGSAPLTVQFTDTSNPGSSPITQWNWSFGDGEQSDLQNPVHIYQNAGNYTVTLQVTNSTGSDTFIAPDLVSVLNDVLQITFASITNPFDGVDITARADIQPGAYPISEVTFYYSIDDGLGQSEVANYQGGSIWTAPLGHQPGGAKIVWRIVATDAHSNKAIWPQYGGWSTVIVLEPGTIVGWGSTSDGVCTVPGLNEDFVSIAGGSTHSLGLKIDGTIVAWGSNSWGQCFIPAPNSDFVAIAAGDGFGLGLKYDGRIVSSGRNDHGQCNIPEPNAGFVSAAAGAAHSLGLKADGTIVAWGWNEYGQCDIPEPNTSFIAAAAGGIHSLGLKADGTVVAWGANTYGQCDIPAPNNEFVAVAGGLFFSLGLKSDGAIVAWGRNDQGQCDVPEPNADFVSVAAGFVHSVGMKSDEQFVAWGSNYYGQCNIPAPNSDYIATAVGDNHNLAIRRPSGEPQIYAYVLNGIVGADITVQASIVAGAAPINTVTLYYMVDNGLEQSQAVVQQGDSTWISSLGEYVRGTEIAWRLVIIDEQSNETNWPRVGDWREFTVVQPGAVVAWGDNAEGQCDVPAPNEDFVAVSGGSYHNVGLNTEGAVVAWGRNDSGECEVPRPNANFIAVAAGYGFSLGLKSDGRIVAWGDGSHGKCYVPSPNRDFVAIAAGNEHSLGLRSDGTIVAWGLNALGQLNTPLINAEYVRIFAGSYHNAGLKSDGTIVAWGLNNFGQCIVPMPNSNFVAVAGGTDHCLALNNDGTIVAWGFNGFGQCDVPAPNSDFKSMAGGCRHSLGLKYDGTIVGWGSNSSGQLDVPAPNEDFFAISGGVWHSIGVRGNPTISVPDSSSADEIPIVLAIRTVAPNPFNPGTTIYIDLPTSGTVSVAVHDLRGRLVRTLWRGEMTAGRSSIAWDGTDKRGQQAASGVYVVRLASADGAQKVAKITLAK